MRRRFCDRCPADVTDAAWSQLALVTSPNAEGDGTVNQSWHLCAACVKRLKAFLKPARQLPTVPPNRVIREGQRPKR